MSEIISMPQALRPHPVEIDDTRLNALWARQNRKGLWLAGAAGALAVLVGAALVVMAFRLNAQPPTINVAAPVVNIPEQPAPVVNVTIPPQPAPVVNVTVPQQTPPPVQQQALRTGETRVVSEHYIFHEATVGEYTVITGWKFASSKETVPESQFCYVNIGTTSKLNLARNGVMSTSIAEDARKVGVNYAHAVALLKSCRWTS